MMRFTSLSIKAKLNILIVFVSILLIGIGLTGLWAVRNSNSALYNVYNNRLLSISQMNEVRNNQMQIRINLLTARLDEDPFSRQDTLDKVTTNIFNVDNFLNEYRSRELPVDEQALYDQFIDARMTMGREGVLPIIDLLQTDRIDEADNLISETLNPTYAKASASIDALIGFQIDNAKSEYDRVSHLTRLIQAWGMTSVIMGLTLIIVIGLLITRSINKGVDSLATAARKFSNGELNARATLHSEDELGQVARVFNKMANDFSAVIEKIRRSTNEVTSASEMQSATADQITGLTRNQTEQATSVAESVEGLNTMVKDIVQKTSEIADAATHASDLASHGQVAVNEAVKSIQDISKTVHESSELIDQLGKRSVEIGEIVKVIQSIADQTNLLALNAAIEAARAGEQGRGFAVVADEVKKLAGRTTHATAEISEMIAAIQNDTSSAVNTMNRGSSQVAVGVARANSAGESLQQINQSVRKVSEMISQIAHSTLEESEETNAITNRIEMIADLAREVSGTIGQTSATSHNILDMAHNLQNEVAHFKL
jgi:methyl-accepting chemotaxis protein